jgi:phosphoenolpyruvate synthase/pyruvate phosphate dikinase
MGYFLGAPENLASACHGHNSPAGPEKTYGIPAVVGTWVATSTIKDGDMIRVDGTNGVVEILSVD